MQINYLAVVVAAVAGFLLGWGWYTVFGKAWMAGLGKKNEDCDKAMPIAPMVIAGVACLVMAYMLAGLMGHLANVTIRGGIISAFFVWIGFVLTTVATNHASLAPSASRIECAGRAAHRSIEITRWRRITALA